MAELAVKFKMIQTMPLKKRTSAKKPKTRLKSKRFVAKVMVLSAVTRPTKDHNGVIGCWRVTKPFVYKRTVKQTTRARLTSPATHA